MAENDEKSTPPQSNEEVEMKESIVKELDELKSVDVDLGEEPRLDDSFERSLFVEGIPKTDKVSKLKKFFAKRINTVLPLESPVTLDDYMHFFPLNEETKETIGYLLVEFEDAKEADLWKEKLNGLVLDKRHVLKTCLVSEIDEYCKPQPKKEFKEYKAEDSLCSWLLDERARVQFIIRYQNKSELYWFDSQRKAELAFQKEEWSEHSVMWSPYGNYLATFHTKGIMLWGGEDFKNLAKFPDEGVKLISWSPKENYFLTWVPKWRKIRDGKAKSDAMVTLWNVKSGKKMMTVKTNSEENMTGRSGFMGPRKVDMTFQWSYNERYFARIANGEFELYDSETMTIKENSEFLKGNVSHFSFSPIANVVAAWIPKSADGENPSRFVIVDIESGSTLKQKAYFKPTKNCGIYWQSKGDFVATVVEGIVTQRVEKKGERQRRGQPTPTIAVSKTVTSVDAIYFREKNLPIESTDLDGRITEFSWEPANDRFAIIHKNTQNPNDTTLANNNVIFYSMKDGKNLSKLTQIKTLEKVPVDQISWSPRGAYVLLANFSSNGVMEFWNVDDIELLGTGEHRAATDIEWDPTGRFVTTYISAYSNSDSHGYCIWTFQGDLVTEVVKSNLIQFSWRPRPETFLTAEDEKKLKTGLKDSIKRYKVEDDKWKIRKKEETNKERLKVVEEFRKYQEEKLMQYEEERAMRSRERDGYASGDDEYVTIEQEAEEVIEVLTTALEE